MQRCEWLGGPDDLNLVVGDRVAVVEGPSAGCVGKITSIDPKCAEVQLEGVSQVRLSGRSSLHPRWGLMPRRESI